MLVSHVCNILLYNYICSLYYNGNETRCVSIIEESRKQGSRILSYKTLVVLVVVRDSSEN